MLSDIAWTYTHDPFEQKSYIFPEPNVICIIYGAIRSDKLVQDYKILHISRFASIIIVKQLHPITVILSMSIAADTDWLSIVMRGLSER